MVMAPVVRGRKGEYKKDLEKLARQGFVRARDRRRAALARRRDRARQAAQPHHRSGGGPAAGEAGDREAPGSLHRNRHQAGRRAGADRGGERRRAAVLAEAGLHGMRHQHSAAGAALVFVQQPLRRLRGVPRAGQQVGVRSGQGDRGPFQAAARRRAGAGRPAPGTCSSNCEELAQQAPHQPEEAVRRTCRRRRATLLLEGANGLPGILEILQQSLRDRARKATANGSPSTCRRWSARPATASGCGRPAWRCG